MIAAQSIRTIGEEGVTLLELIIALAIMALLLGFSTLAFTALRAPDQDPIREAIARGRWEAIRSGVPVTASISIENERVRTFRFLPSGRVIGIGTDPWSGRIVDAIH